ncbi:ERF family ssDNA binding protein [Streptomyces phage Darolandstone]|uniref:ERF family ssDNA binding protein n=1 Tax=Streptomyces phage Darolandstone TaxID=2315716 RepID=A0A386KPP1_9CAUD|nr:ERF family ssDNA binding protein [Streptomyces phage Darolandstone]AYD86227.1 ERF family ssDNA binding protein [Streptomyces phage Darolandstone]
MTVTQLHPNQPAPAPVAVEGAPSIRTAYEPAPPGTPAETPRVFQVIHGVMQDVMPVRKDQQNTQQNYAFRGVDDAMSAMAGPMRNHGCFIAPEVVEHRQRPRGDKGTHTNLRMLYRIYGPAGDCLLVTLPGEAMDSGDKSTNKAMSAALKYMLFTVFMIPVDSRSIDDSDQDTAPIPTAPQQRQQGGQQRGQQRPQQRRNGQQGGQQPRRSNRAEAGPWEQQAPAQQQRPDYLAQARKAQNPEAFAKVRAAAVAAGAPPEFVAQLDQVDAAKRQAAQKSQQAPAGQQQRPRPQQQQQQQQQQPNDEQAVAVGELFDAARSAGVTDRAEVEQLFSSKYGRKSAEGTVEQLREMRDDLLDAAKAATA